MGIPEFATSGLFDNTEIDISKLATLSSEPKEKDFDTRSVITSKSFKGLNFTKKDKSKIKKEFWKKSKISQFIYVPLYNAKSYFGDYLLLTYLKYFYFLPFPNCVIELFSSNCDISKLCFKFS